MSYTETFELLRRMNEERQPPKISEWCPPGRRRTGGPRISWTQEVTNECERKELTP